MFNPDQRPPLNALQLSTLTLFAQHEKEFDLSKSQREEVKNGTPKLTFTIELANHKRIEFSVTASHDDILKQSQEKLKEELLKLDPSGHEDLILFEVGQSVIPQGKTEADEMTFGTTPIKQQY